MTTLIHILNKNTVATTICILNLKINFSSLMQFFFQRKTITNTFKSIDKILNDNFVSTQNLNKINTFKFYLCKKHFFL